MKKKTIKSLIKTSVLTMVAVACFSGSALKINAGGYYGEDISGYDAAKNEYFSYYSTGTDELSKTYWQWHYDSYENEIGWQPVTLFQNTVTEEYLKNGWFVVDGEEVYFDENGYSYKGFLNGRQSNDGGWELGYKNVYTTDPQGKYGDDLNKLEKVKYDWIVDDKGIRYGATGYFYDSDSGNDYGVAYGTHYLLGEVTYLKDDKDWYITNIDGKSYRFEADGYVATDMWFDDGYKIDETWYPMWKYATSDGSLAKGWTEIDGEWYFFDNENFMVTTDIVDGYYLGEDGTIAEGLGWYNDWLWENEEQGTKTDRWMYIDSDGVVSTGWTQIDGYWYYFSNEKYNYGIMCSSSVQEGYYFTEDGTLATGGWYSDWYWTDEEKGEWDSNWKYVYSDGSVASGWTQIDGTWYYFNTGKDTIDVGDTTYTFWYSGMAKDEYVDGYYLDKNGVLDSSATASWYQDSNGWYFMDSNGWYPSNSGLFIDGMYYEFDANGYMVSE